MFTVTVTVTDDDHRFVGNGQGSASFTVTVNNLAPLVTASNDQTVNEGGAVSLFPTTFSDLGQADTHTASINWGDGTVTPGTVNQQAGTVSGTHPYADDGTYTVTVTVTDKDHSTVVNGQGSDTFKVTVNNVAPRVSAVADQNATEGSTLSLSPIATFTDVGQADTHTASINWSDGSVTTSTVNQAAGTVSGSHAYADEGTYTVTVTVTDDDGGSDSDSFKVSVSNVAPSVIAGNDQVTNEGSFITLAPATFSDPAFDCLTCVPTTTEDFIATVDWGDGSSVLAADITLVETLGGTGTPTTGTVTVQASHAYGDDGAYTVTVEVCDDDGGCGSNTLTVTVNNVAPTKDVGKDQFTFEGLFIDLDPVTFTDPGFDVPSAGTEENFTATIDWGDGTTEPAADVRVEEIPGGEGTLTRGTIQAIHAYADDGNYTVRIEVCDDNGGCSGGRFDVTVENIPLLVDAGVDQTVDEGAFVTLPPTTFEDFGFDNPAALTEENFTATIDWGDGTTEPVADITVSEVPGNETTLTTGTAQASHAYEDDGIYTVRVCVRDDDDAQTCDTLEVTVNNADPSIDAGPDQTTNEGTFITLGPATYTDPGFDHSPTNTEENFTTTVDWGDGTSELVSVIALTETPGSEGVLTTGTVQASHAYGDDGIYTVRVCVRDDDDAETCDTMKVTVNNVDPSVEAGADQTTNEGTFITLGPADYSDPGFDNPSALTEENFTATVDWGDGTTEPFGHIALTETPGSEGVLTTGTVQASHAYGDDGIYTVRVCVQDDDDGETCDTLTVTVNNVFPALEAGAHQTTNEGAFITLDPADYSDPGFDNSAAPTQENFSATIDWGDGTTEHFGHIALTETPGSEGPLTEGTIQASHAYGDNGIYTVRVCVKDDDDAETCDTLTVTVNNVFPALEAGAHQTTNEGTFITLDPADYSDPGFNNPSALTEENFTATVDWGDGTTEPFGHIALTETPGSEGLLTEGTIQASHAYGDNGIYTVRVCVKDDDAETCDTLTITVDNVAPSVDAGADQTIDEGQSVTVNPTFSDPGFTAPPAGTVETFMATIDWGEGTFESRPVSVIQGSEGVLTTGGLSGTQTYGDNGVFTVEVCVTDDDDGKTCATLEVTVNNVDPTLTLDTSSAITFLSGDDAYLGRKGVEQTHLADATDPGSDDLTFNWTFLHDPTAQSTIYFNNGSSDDPLPSPHGTFQFSVFGDSASVTFTAAGVYTVRIDTIDDDTGSDFNELPKLVTDDCDCAKSQGFWQHQFSGKGKQHIDDVTLAAYLDVENFASGVFSEDVPLSSLADAWNVMQPGGPEVGDPHPSNMKGKATKQALAAWLNFAEGGVLWNQIVPSGQPFHDAMAQIEAILLDPGSTHGDYVLANEIAEAINTMDEGNPECEDAGNADASGGGDDGNPGGGNKPGNKGKGKGS